jgi:protein SCO1/2
MIQDSRRSTAIEPWAVAALGAWLVITVGWWALALWPMPADTPDWLSRARAVCFNTTETGLPDASGWLLLIGQPLGMLGVMLVGWSREVKSTISGLAAGRSGRVVLAAVSLVVAGGLLAAGARVAEARSTAIVRIPVDAAHPDEQPRAHETPPAFSLIDETGRTVGLDDFRGRPVLLTFAFGHCETVCPLVVMNAKLVRSRMPAAERPILLVITLDPWRDTPGRLPSLAKAWELGPDAHALSGSVDEVNAVLDAWDVQRTRQPGTGDIIHAPVVYIIDADGRVAFASTGEIESLTGLVDRL